MARFNRINLDGLSVTETRTSEAALKPGQAVAITSGLFVAPTGGAAKQRLYVVNAGGLQGLQSDQDIPAGDSVEGEYLESGRDLAVLVGAGVAVVKDSPLAVASTGLFKLADAATESTPADQVVAYAQETYTTSAGGAELVWARGV